MRTSSCGRVYQRENTHVQPHTSVPNMNVTPTTCPHMGDGVARLLMAEMRIVAVHGRRNIPCTHLLRTLWVHSRSSSVAMRMPGTHNVSVDLDACTDAILWALRDTAHANPISDHL